MVQNFNIFSFRRFCFRTHPERPERILEIIKLLKETGLFERCHKLESRKATEEELQLVHGKVHLRKIKETEEMPESKLKYLSDEKRNSSVYFNGSSYNSALVAAGSVLQVIGAN